MRQVITLSVKLDEGRGLTHAHLGQRPAARAEALVLVLILGLVTLLVSLVLYVITSSIIIIIIIIITDAEVDMSSAHVEKGPDVRK